LAGLCALLAGCAASSGDFSKSAAEIADPLPEPPDRAARARCQALARGLADEAGRRAEGPAVGESLAAYAARLAASEAKKAAAMRRAAAACAQNKKAPGA